MSFFSDSIEEAIAKEQEEKRKRKEEAKEKARVKKERAAKEKRRKKFEQYHERYNKEYEDLVARTTGKTSAEEEPPSLWRGGYSNYRAPEQKSSGGSNQSLFVGTIKRKF